MIKVEYRALTKNGFEDRELEIKDDELDAFLKTVDAIEPRNEVGNGLKEKGDHFIVHPTQSISAIVLRKES